MNVGSVPLTFKPLEAQKEKHYGLRLHFAEIEDIKPGERVFDILVNGKTVITDLDIAKEAGGALKALTREIHDISATDFLELEFVPKKKSLPPILSGIELIKK